MNCLSLVHYLEQALYQRAAYLLDYFREELQLSQEFLEYCKNQVGKGTEMRYEDENIWLTQRMLGSLYDCKCAKYRSAHQEDLCR